MARWETIHINGLPGYSAARRAVLSPNARVHWRHRHAVLKADKLRTLIACRAAGMGDLNLQKAHVEVVIRYRTHQRRDYDNQVGLLKGVMDGMVAAGVLADDNRSVIGSLTITQEHGDPEGFRLIVEEG